MLSKWLKGVTLHQRLVGVPVNGRFPSHAPVDVPFYVAQDGKKILGKVFLRLHVILCLPCPIFPTLNQVPDEADVEIQLAGLTILCHVHTSDHNVTNR